MQRSRDRLNSLIPGLGVNELSKEIRSLVAFHFGYSCARVMISTTRAPNDLTGKRCVIKLTFGYVLVHVTSYPKAVFF